MRHANSIGKYQLTRTIGEGTFAKVKLAVNTDNGEYAAIKIIDKHMVIANNLIYQVQREIRTMKLLNHPNIVRIYEVIATKTKVYFVMEYVSGGGLSDKMSYVTRLDEKEARKHFQQLIDAIDYCHDRGVYHRDLKPENLLLDNKGNLKVSDFGLSALRKPGDLLSTTCGSPSYVAPELLRNKSYEGEVADVWSCGIILFESLAGYLPFKDCSLMSLYRKILRADYKFPEWFTESQKNLISRILCPDPQTRITVADIIEDKWFQKDYQPALRSDCDESFSSDDVHQAFSSIKENETETKLPKSPSFINAFQLIAMSRDLDLSGLFEDQETEKQRTTIGAKHTINETIEKIEAAAKDVSLLVQRMDNSTMKVHVKQKMTTCSRSGLSLSAEVIEVAPIHCVIRISKSAGDLRLYKEFCKSLSSMLTEESGAETQTYTKVIIKRNHIHESEREKDDNDYE